MTTVDSRHQHPAKIPSCSCSLCGSLSLPLTETEEQVIFSRYVVYYLRAVELLRRIRVTKWKAALARRNLRVSRAQGDGRKRLLFKAVIDGLGGRAERWEKEFEELVLGGGAEASECVPDLFLIRYLPNVLVGEL